MEPLSGAASVISVASLAIQICDSIKKVHEFWSSVEDAPSEIAQIAAELHISMQWLTIIANNYQRQPSFGQNGTLVSTNDSAAIATLQLCMMNVQSLSKEISAIEIKFGRTGSSRRWTSLKAAWRKDRIEKTLRETERMKTLLILVQTSDIRYVSRNRKYVEACEVDELSDILEK